MPITFLIHLEEHMCCERLFIIEHFYIYQDSLLLFYLSNFAQDVLRTVGNLLHKDEEHK